MPNGWDRTRFLETFAETGHVGTAAREAGMSRQMAYLERARDPLFAAEWDAAKQRREPVPIPGIFWIMGRNGTVIGHTLVDVEDWERFRHLRWNFAGPGYVATSTKPRTYLHRMILGLNPSSELECDHINRNPLDNRRANLRRCTRKENCANRGGIFDKSAA